MILFGLYALVFLGGPLIFRSLTQDTPSRLQMQMLGVVTAICAAVGLGLRYGFAKEWGHSAAITVTGMLLIWFAWISVLAFAVQALRQTDTGRRMRLWTGVIGALGTTVPWFGLAWAHLVSAGT